jgi:hypothetical protein
MNGIELIAAERKRQIEEEGWTPGHDDGHKREELCMAGAYYAIPDAYRRFCPDLWPPNWDGAWFKPTPYDRIRELVKAGALIAAEIDRLQRLAPSGETKEEKE